jgi:dihydrofolate reductase
LEQVLGVLCRADDPVDVKLQLTPIRVGQLAERVFVAATRAGEGLLAHIRILALALPFIRITSTTSGRLEIRRSVFVAADASTNNDQQSKERRAAMGKIVISENVSLDGVVQDPAGDEGFMHGGWVGRITDRPEVGKLALDEALGAGAFLLGRRSYEWFAAKWPFRSGELADRLNSLPKYVVSSTLEDPDWNNSTALKGDVVNEVPKLKQEIDGDIVVPGSFQLLRTLMEHDLVDELRLKIFPVVLGAGQRLFGETSDKKPMRLVETQTLDDGIAFLTYERIQDA